MNKKRPGSGKGALAWSLVVSALVGGVASAQFGGGPSVPDWVMGLALLIGGVFAGLMVGGMFSGLGALLGHRKLDAARRLALRLIGLNWLEPGVTLLGVVLATRSGVFDERTSPLTLLLGGALGWAALMLPAFFVRAPLDAPIQAALKTLRLSAVLRGLSAGLTLWLANLNWQVDGVHPTVVAAGLSGLVVLAWSVLSLGRRAAALSTPQHGRPESGGS